MSKGREGRVNWGRRMPKVCHEPHLQLREDTTEAYGRSTFLLRGQVGFQEIGDTGGRSPVQTIQMEIVSVEGRGHLDDEGRVLIGHGSPTVPGSMVVRYVRYGTDTIRI